MYDDDDDDDDDDDNGDNNSNDNNDNNNINNEILIKRELLIDIRARRAVQENRKIAFKLGHYQ